ncbi:TetR/AcrR family transcriptional regulator [Streptomyces himalayensis]|uniref:TetR/AcrR family transcriptional regulator n=1 Tax=Streptomyces himalayensis subsp. himalayensis TaxID=2756131 RepID=A0A7W0DRS8_9ACTN|nr:TetR/AcrR family transcriptional regulator [Streptomyces himalayensis]MBA2949650.1 TetR/AcrR family transcriptional regulator [Streptomyces himalayensis subsp. himalayensis]
MASTTRRRSSAADRRSALERRILSVIEELLSGGVTYTELSVEQIAHAAGISRSTFYLYFRDKVDVLLRLSGSLKTESHAIASSWRPCGPGGGLDGLARTYELILRHYRKHAALLSAINEVAAYDPAVREAWTADQDRFVDHVVTVLKEEQQAGRTPADIDPELAARVIVQGGGQVIAQQVSGSDGDDAALARELANGYWYGVYRRSHEAAAG